MPAHLFVRVMRSTCIAGCIVIGTASGQQFRPMEYPADIVHGSPSSSAVDDAHGAGGAFQPRRSVFVQLNANALFASLKDWKNQLYLSDGTHPSSICTVFGGELGCVFSSHFQIGLGYELFFSPSVDAVAPSPNLTDQITGSFAYGTLKAGSSLESVPELFIFGAVDVGTLKATESLDNYGGFNFERTGKSLAYRLKAGAQYYTSETWSVNLEAGYLVGKMTNVSGSVIGPYALDFSGIEVRFAVNYHIPFS